MQLGRGYAGGRAWWWIDLDERVRRQALGERDITEVPEGLAAARAQVDELLGAIERELHPPTGKLVLGGFSQGAMLSLDVTLRTARRLAALVLMSGTHLAATEWKDLFPRRRGLPVLMSHGQDDPLLPFSIAEGLRDVLVASGIPVEWVPFRGGHGIAPTVLARASAFLTRVLS
jgi:phospholipase/carboxylesterase